MALGTVSPNTTKPDGIEGPNPAYVATEETFEGWGGGDVEASLDEPEPEDAIDEDTEESEDDETDEEGEEETEPSEDEAEEEETEEEEQTEATEEDEEEDVEQYTDVGKKGRERIQQLLAEKKATSKRFEEMERRLAEAEKRSSMDRIAEQLEAQRKIQEQAWEHASRQRQEYERAQAEAAELAQLQARGYNPVDFSHNLAVENMRKIDEFIAQFNPRVETFDQQHRQLENQRLANQYMGEITSYLDKSIEGLPVKPELKQWLHETAIELGAGFDLTAEEAVQRAFAKATRLGVVPKRLPKSTTTKPKAKPPEAVLKTVAKGANRSGRKPGKQTKGGRQRPRDPEDEAFAEVDDGEW